MNENLTTREAAALIGVPEATLRYWRHLGNVGPRSWKCGPKRVMYRRTDVLAWLEAQYAAVER